MSVGQLNQESLAYLLELTLLRFCNWRNGVEAGTMCSREIYEVVANPGLDFVHESFRIGKGGCSEAGDGKARSRIA
jgi:hypothetical protein